jgi:hypothetical protein
MTSLRANFTATLQPNGKVLIAGDNFSNTSSAELFDIGLDYSENRRPIVSSVGIPEGQSRLVISGSGFRGDSEASSGATNSSPTDYPLVQLQRVDNDQSLFLLSDPSAPWSDTSFTSRPLEDLHLPMGHYRTTVYTNAIPSIAQLIAIDSSFAAIPAITTSPQSLDFGDITVNAVSTIKAVSVTNNGTADLVISGIAINGTDTTQFAIAAGGTCGTLLAPGTGCQVNIVFKPTSVNGKNVTLRVSSNDPVNGTVDIPLTGTGVASTQALAITFAGTGAGLINVNPSPPGMNCSSGCIQSFTVGTAVTLTASADAGSMFIGWTNCDNISGTTCNVVMNANRSITATFSHTDHIRSGDFASLQEAYNHAAHNDTVMALSKTYVEELLINRPIDVTLQGGYVNTSYSTRTGSTVLKGSLVIAGGTVTVDNLTITSSDPNSSLTIDNVTTTSSTISWITNLLANSRVDYGETSSYSGTKGDGALTTSHSITLTGLNPGTTYHYKVSSSTNAGVSATSTDYTFNTPGFVAATIAESGNITVMEVSGNYDAKNPDVTDNTLPRQQIAREYIRTHGDTFDFLVILSSFDYAMPEPTAKGFYLEVKNDTQGINRPIFDNSAQFGSNGKLQGTIDLGNITALAANPHGPKLDETVATLNHELMHRYGSYVRFKNPDGTLNTSLLGKDSAHWSYLLDSNGWQDNGNGTFTATAANSGFSPLDLYLMGMIDKSQVPPMVLIENGTIDKTKLPQLGATVSGTAKTVTIDDIIAAEGARIPNTATSPKKFNVGFVLLTRPGVPMGNAPAAIETLRSAWAGKFAELTRGIGGANGVTPSLTVNVDSPADGATSTGPDTTVTGTIINSSGAETGIMVDGQPATVSGSRFIANHVPLQEGANTITITATDVNGLTSTTTRSVTAQAGHYLRISSNIDSGTGPLDISLRVDGSFSIANPTVTISGPVSVSLSPGASPTDFTTKLTVEGTYILTASATGPDGQIYSDSVTVTVVSKSQLEALLQGKWEGIKTKFSSIDVEGAVSYLASFKQARYREIFSGFGPRLPVLGADMPAVKLAYATEERAKCVLIRQEIVVGEQQTVAYPVYYIKENGVWKLLKY